MLDQLQRMHVLVYSVATEGEAAVIFETTNDRGKPLSVLDKTKSFLMQHLYNTYEHPEEPLKAVNSAFAEIYSMLDFLDDNSVVSFDDESVQRWHFIETEPNWKSRKDYQNYFAFIKRRLNEIARTEPSSNVQTVRVRILSRTAFSLHRNPRDD